MCSLVFSLLYLHYLRQEKKKLTFGAQHHRLCLFMYVVWVKDRLTNSLLLLCATFFLQKIIKCACVLLFDSSRICRIYLI